MKKLLLLILTVCMFAALPVRGEPVTMVVLAPVALKVAKDASPHVISGMRSGGQQLIAVAKDIADIVKLPWGVIQATAGMPFGYTGDGLNNIWQGVCAPFALVMDIVKVPLAFAGAF